MTLWLLALALLAALAPPSVANDRGDKLKDRKSAVSRQERKAHRELDQSTASLHRAARRLEAARAQVHRARDVYRTAHQQRLAAALIDDQAQAALDQAEAELAATERRVADAQRRIGEREDDLRAFAVESFQSGDTLLLSVSAVLTADEPLDLVGRLGSVRTVVDREAAAMSRLEAARTVLEVQQVRLEETRDAVAQRRAEAATTLQERQGAEDRAEAARIEVQRLAAIAKERKDEARKARAEDLKQLRKIRKERQRVEKMLRRYYERLRRAEARREARLAPGKGGMLWPAEGWVSSSYGMRLHPVYHRWRLHDGLDIAAPCGRPVRATARGVVVARYYNSAYGKRVVVAHGARGGKGLATTYNHLRRIKVRSGERVRPGQVIGFIGSTGFSTGCHLHYMVLRDGRPVNPARWLR